jgi:hypothetical protein
VFRPAVGPRCHVPPPALEQRKEYPPDLKSGVLFKLKTCSRACSTDRVPFRAPRRERDPRRYSYTCVPCPEFRKGREPAARTTRAGTRAHCMACSSAGGRTCVLHCARRRPTALSSETTCIEDGEVGEAREVNGAEVSRSQRKLFDRTSRQRGARTVQQLAEGRRERPAQRPCSSQAGAPPPASSTAVRGQGLPHRQQVGTLRHIG